MCDASACTSDYDDCYADGTYEAQTCKDGFMPVPLGSSEYTCCADTPSPHPPGLAPAPPPPLPPSLVHATTGPCVATGDCVCSSNYPANKCDATSDSNWQYFEGSEACTVSFTMPVTLSVHVMEESCQGMFMAEGDEYFCNYNLDGVNTNYMTWDLDANVDSNGFKICAHAPSSPHPPDQAPSPPPPAACIGDDRKCTSDYNDCYADGVYEMQFAGLVLKLQTN